MQIKNILGLTLIIIYFAGKINITKKIILK